jgi:hypothetical protein
MAERGDKIAVKIGDSGSEVILVGIRNTSKSLTMDEEESTTRDTSGNAKTFVPIRYDETISVDGLRDTTASSRELVEDMVAKLKAGTIASIVYGGTETGDTIYTGEGFFTSLEETNPYDALQEWSGELRITGEMTKSTVA